MSDETPDTTGLREAVLTELDVCPFKENVNDASMCLCGLPALDHDILAERIVLNDHPAIAALLAAHPTPDASPDPTAGERCICTGEQRFAGTARPGCPIHDPAVVTPDAGDVSLADADDVALADWWVSEGGDYEDLALDSLTPVVERIVANHVAAAREADRAEVERLRALADMYLEEHDKQHARAETAEERLAGFVAQIEALADEWERVAARLSPGSLTAGVRDNCARDLRALIPADAATSLDAVREQAKAEALREMSQKFRTEAAEVWGGNGSWLTTGRKVADLVSFWCDDEADQIENREGATDD